MTTGIAWVIFGALAIAIGGASTTYGWSKIAGETEKQNHVKAIARALHFNTEYMSIWPLDMRDEPTKAGVEHWAFPEFKKEPMSTALLSSYFSSSNERLFMIALANYEILAQAHNKNFERYNEYLKINLEKMGKEAVLKKIRRSKGVRRVHGIFPVS
jgi:hypothetical protein